MNENIPFILTTEPKYAPIDFPLRDHEEKIIQAVSLNHIGDIDQICEDSAKGFKIWSSTDLKTRRAVLISFKSNIIEIENILKEECRKIGMPQWFAEFNYSLALEMIDNTIYNMSTLDEGSIPVSDKSDQLSMVFRQPVGPVFSVSPWNAPVILTMRSILGPLLAGCSVLVKSSELSAKISYLICNAFVSTNMLPPGTMQLIHTRIEDVGEIVKSIISNDHIKMVNFTGSTLVGIKISEMCGRLLKPCLLELGGKNSIIVDHDVSNLESALQSSLFSAWSHKGQICMCSDRLYIHESIYDESLDKIVKIAKEFINHDLKLNQRNELQSTKIKKLIDDAVSKNAKIIFDIEENENDHGNYVGPIILADVTHEMDLYKTETFGPVLTVAKYSSMDKLIDELNEEKYGLKTSIWSSNHLKLIQYLKKIQSGGVHINSSTINDEPWLPHGGVKDSGNGRFNGKWGIESFSYIKTITLHSS